MTKEYKRKIDYNKYKSRNLLEAKKKMKIRFARNKISINLSKGSNFGIRKFRIYFRSWVIS